MTQNRKIVAVLTARAGREAELEALLRGMVVASRAEPGALRYDLWQDADAPGRFVVDELYRDDDAVAAHRATPHFGDYATRIADLADRAVIVGRPVDVV